MRGRQSSVPHLRVFTVSYYFYRYIGTPLVRLTVVVPGTRNCMRDLQSASLLSKFPSDNDFSVGTTGGHHCTAVIGLFCSLIVVIQSYLVPRYVST